MKTANEILSDITGYTMKFIKLLNFNYENIHNTSYIGEF